MAGAELFVNLLTAYGFLGGFICDRLCDQRHRPWPSDRKPGFVSSSFRESRRSGPCCWPDGFGEDGSYDATVAPQ